MSNWNLISHLFSQTSTSSFSAQQLLKDKTTNPNRSKPGPKPGSLAASKKRQSSDNNKKATGTLPPTSSSTSNTNTLTTTTQPIKKKLSVQQAAVNDMMKRALEEDKYSALGSVVNVNSDDSSDDDDDDEGDTNNEVEEDDEDDIRWNHRPKRSNSSSSDVADKPWGATKEKQKVDRTTLQLALRKHIRLESQKSVRNFEERTFFTDAEDYLVSGSSTRNASKHSRSMSPMRNGVDGIPDEDLAIDGRRIGKRRKKKKKKGAVATAAAAAGQQQIDAPMESSGADDTPMTDKSGNDDEWEENNNAGGENNGEDVEFVAQEEESIFGQTQGSSNATWVECDRCKKVSR